MIFKKMNLIVLFLMFFLLSSPSALMITSTKIAYVNMEEVFNRLGDIKKARKELKETVENKSKKIAELEQGIASVKNKLVKEKDSLPPEELEVFEGMIKTKEEELKNIMEESKEFVVAQEEILRTKIMGNIYDAIDSIAESDSYTVILDKDTVIYSEDSVVNITEEIIKHLNRENK